MKYVARTYTSIYPYGLIARGEALEEKHIRALGETGIADLLARGVIKTEGPISGAEAPVSPATGTNQGENTTSGDDAPPPNEGEDLDEADVEDGEELTDLDGLDELAGEAPENEAAPSKAKKPAAKRAGGRKAK